MDYYLLLHVLLNRQLEKIDFMGEQLIYNIRLHYCDSDFKSLIDSKSLIDIFKT